MKRLAIIGMSMMWTASALRADDELAAKINALANPYVEHELVVGMSVGIVKGTTTLTLGYGTASSDKRQPPDGDTVYEIGSTSKTFTGVLLGTAVALGEVTLDQDIQTLLPDGVVVSDDELHPITLRSLSTHVSGLPRLPDNLQSANPLNPYADYTTEKMYAFVAKHQLARDVGTSSEYSNLGVGLLGQLLVNAAQQKDYAALLQERIAGPLGMQDTVIELTDPLKKRLAQPHAADGTVAHNWDLPALTGAGGIRSTSRDMLKYVQAQLEPPADSLGKGIDLAYEVQQPPISDKDFAMGLGWHVARDGTTRWHNGETGGYHSMVLVNRTLKAGVVVLANTATAEVDRLAEEIMRTLAGMPVQPRTFSPEVRVDAATMQPYIGKYQLAPGFVFTVSVKDEQLLVGLTGQPTLRVFPKSKTEWFYKVVDAQLTFKMDPSGKCNEVVLFQNGIQQTAKRIESE